MPELQDSRRKLKIAIAAMVAADLVAAAVLFSPLVGSAQSRRISMSELSAELHKKTREVKPLRDIDKKIGLAKDQISQFYKDRFAARDSDLAAELGKLASANGVRILQAKYKQEDPTGAGIFPVEIEGNFSGDYLQLIRFINALERSKQFFTVDSVSLAGESAGPVRLEVKMHSYLRSGA
ncbi:MAG: GspMb/PilO family protein [Terriglobales bacterium]